MSARRVKRRERSRAPQRPVNAPAGHGPLIFWFGALGLIAGAVLLVSAVFAFLGPESLTELGTALQKPADSAPLRAATHDPAPFGDCPPETDAERELEAMLHGPDGEIDLALANYLVVCDLPQFRDLTREAYFERLDQATAQRLTRSAYPNCGTLLPPR